MNSPETLYSSICEEAENVLVGNEDVLEGITIALLTGGHILLEGVPGVAKTTAAKLFSRATGLQYQRIQMTPDVLPADITGTHVYRENSGEFELRRGPVFSNIVLADEINRATPKTQSALLEAMQEQHATIEGNTLELPTPFIVIATQNPIEYEGTFNLPEAQRDRFLFKLTVDIPKREHEREILERFKEAPNLGPEDIERVVSLRDLKTARGAVRDVHVDDKVYDYILNLVTATRESSAVEHGASPRASLGFLHASQARAALRGREYVIPDDVKALAPSVLTHRLVLSADADLSGRTVDDVVDDVVESVAVPEADLSFEAAVVDE